MMSVAHAVRQAGSVDPTAIRDALANLKPFEGVMGPTNSYSEARTMTSSPVAVVWTDGALELLDESYAEAAAAAG